MKVLIAAPYYAPKPGGLENYAAGVAQALVRSGHDVLVVAGNHGGAAERSVVGGVDVRRLKPWLKLSNTPVGLWWYFALRRAIRSFQPDVVMAHTPVPYMADMAARAAGRRPFVLVYHNDLAKDSRLLRAAVALYWRLLGRKTLRRADQIIATSQFYADRSPFIAPYRRKMSIIAPGIDPGRFHTGHDRSWLKPAGQGGQVVSFVASLDRTHAHKGLDMLLEAIAEVRRELPDVQLVVGGRGDGLDGYRAKAEGLGISSAVTFLGFVSDDDLPKLYAGSDAFILPSTNEAEGFGMVLLEAAACGTPVIGTDVGGIPAALAACGSTNVCPPTVEGVKSAILRVLTSQRNDSGNAANVAQIRTWQNAADETVVAFERARMPKVLLLHNVIPPYRLDLFDEVARQTRLKVLFAQAKTRDRMWAYDLDGRHFDYEVLRGMTLGPVALNFNALASLWRSRFDVLITNSDIDTAPLTCVAIVVAKLRRAKVVVWSEVTDAAVQSLPGWSYGRGIKRSLALAIGRAVMTYRRLVWSLADGAVAFSATAEAFMRRYGFSGPVSRSLQVMPVSQLGVPKVAVRKTGTTFLYVGYLNPRKNVGLLISAFAKVKDPTARLVIAGSGPDEQALRRMAHDDGRVSFVGFVDGEAKADLYGQSHVLVLTTLSDCWGLVINEAMYFGLAVVVSDAAASCELVDAESGLIFGSGNQTALTAYLERLAIDHNLRDAMGRNNLTRKDVTDVRTAALGILRSIGREVN